MELGLLSVLIQLSKAFVHKPITGVETSYSRLSNACHESPMLLDYNFSIYCSLNVASTRKAVMLVDHHCKQQSESTACSGRVFRIVLDREKK